MSDDVWDLLSPQIPTEHNTIYIQKFGCDAVPGNFIVLGAEGVDSGATQPNLEREEIGRITSKCNSLDGAAANINIFIAPRHLPLRHHGRIGPLCTPSTQYMRELVQTEQVKVVSRKRFLRFAYVLHNDDLSAADSSMYLQGMKDMYVVRYRYDGLIDM